MKTYNVITIFPEMIDAVFKQGVVSKALEKGIISPGLNGQLNLLQ